MQYQEKPKFSLVAFALDTISVCDAQETCHSGWKYQVGFMSNQCSSALWHRENEKSDSVSA